MKAPILISLFILSSFNFASTQDLPICRGLVLQGGSDKGAYHAGALQGLLESLGEEEISYDVISGVTIGSLNAALMSQFEKGKEKTMVSTIQKFWQELKPSNMYRNWKGGPAQGLFLEPSIFDNEPGAQYLKSHLAKRPQRYLAIGAANANTGTYKAFHNFDQNLEAQNVLDAVMASNGVVGLFPYKDINGSTYFDGSVLKSLDVASVVNQCKKLTGNRVENIVIDMILLAGKSLSKADVTNYRSIQVLLRTLEITSYQNSLFAFLKAKHHFPEIDFRYVVIPSAPLPSALLPFSYKKKEIEEMIGLGRKDAIQQVKSGVGTGFKTVVEHASMASKRSSTINSSQDFFARLERNNEALRDQSSYILD